MSDVTVFSHETHETHDASSPSGRRQASTPLAGFVPAAADASRRRWRLYTKGHTHYTPDGQDASCVSCVS